MEQLASEPMTIVIHIFELADESRSDFEETLDNRSLELLAEGRADTTTIVDIHINIYYTAAFKAATTDYVVCIISHKLTL